MPIFSRATWLPLALTVGALHCSGKTSEVGAFEPGPSPSGSGQVGAAPGGGGATPAGAGAGAGAGDDITIHVGATATPFAHKDGLSGLTPLDSRLGIVSLTLLRSASDPSPWVVFDRGVDYVEAGLNDGDDTEVGRVARSLLVNDTFTLAKVGVTHVRYRVPSTMHLAISNNGVPVTGTFDNVQALADGVTLGNGVRASGWYRYSFVAQSYAVPVEGANAPLPTSASAGPFTLSLDAGKASYTFPVNLKASGDATRVSIVVNVHDQFRWQDQATTGFTAGVFDSTPSSYEPVRKFGANAFALAIE